MPGSQRGSGSIVLWKDYAFASFFSCVKINYIFKLSFSWKYSDSNRVWVFCSLLCDNMEITFRSWWSPSNYWPRFFWPRPSDLPCSLLLPFSSRNISCHRSELQGVLSSSLETLKTLADQGRWLSFHRFDIFTAPAKKLIEPLASQYKLGCGSEWYSQSFSGGCFLWSTPLFWSQSCWFY